MTASNKRLRGFYGAFLLLTLSTASIGADVSVRCHYDVLTAAYEHLAACGVKISPERYETYKRLRTALKDFINSNSSPDKPRMDSAHEERLRERARSYAERDKCQGETRQFGESIFELWTTEESATQILGKLSYPHDPYQGDCL
jgi:hypothetical protein